MGANQAKCTVATLNYSGIYLSPFQFYGIDNWKQLEKIGRIFEQLLKEYYPDLKEQSQRLGDSSLGEVYNRSNFRWNIGDIDKHIHRERYSPLYFPAGIIKQYNKQFLANQKEFCDKWEKTFKAIQEQKRDDLSQAATTAKNSKEIQKFHCKMLDLLCYKAIVLYLNAKLRNDKQSYIDYLSCQFQNITNKNKDTEKYSQLVIEYKIFMNQYFKRIDTQSKLQLTQKTFLKDNGPEIIVFSQATHNLRDRLENNSNSSFFIFGPKDRKKVKQTLILIKKSLSFKEMEQLGQQQQNSIKNILQKQLNKHHVKIIEYFKPKSAKLQKKQQQNVQKFADKMKQQGILHWTDGVIFTKCKDQRQADVIISGFHLSSKPQINAIQVQIVGLIIYHLLAVKKYNFIFAGDFNSFISLKSKDNCHGLFQLTRELFDVSDNKINNLQKQVNIFPKHSQIITTKKKRTILQPQVRKANELTQRCIDQIITSYSLKSDLSHVCQISDVEKGKIINQNFIPNKLHPYDNFLVQATLDLNVVSGVQI